MTALRRHGWWGLFGLAALIVILGVGDIVGGPEFNAALALAIGGVPLTDLVAAEPAYRVIDFDARSGGFDFALIGVLFAVLAAIPLRDGQRWAWWTMWLLPLWLLASFAYTVAYGLAPGQALPASSTSGPVLAVIAAGLLLVTYPRGTARSTGVGA